MLQKPLNSYDICMTQEIEKLQFLHYDRMFREQILSGSSDILGDSSICIRQDRPTQPTLFIAFRMRLSHRFRLTAEMRASSGRCDGRDAGTSE